MSFLGDRPFGQTVYDKFTTVNASGLPTTLGNTPSLAYFVDNDTTLYTSGLGLTADYASKTGLNAVSAIVTTSCTGMVSGVDVQIIVAAGTVSGVSLVGYQIANFSINKSSALKPATATRTLIVSASGGAAIDWSNVQNPTSTVGLTGTTISASQVVASVTGAVGSVTGSVGSVASVTNIVTGAITVSGGMASVDVKKVNAITVNGAGTAGNPWGP